MLSVQAGDRSKDLVQVLVENLRVPMPDPFHQEWISVPSLGFRSWLRFQLAQHLTPSPSGTGPEEGIAANLDLPFPGTLRWLLLDAHTRHQGLDHQVDPWQVESLIWHIMAVLEEPSADLDPRLRTSDRLGASLAGRAGPIADLFDRYGVHRPDMVRAWAQGHDTGPLGHPLPATHAWQPSLYRAVRHHISTTFGTLPPAERLPAALELTTTGHLELIDTAGRPLPERMFVFGQSIIPADLGPIVQALAAHRDVTVLLLSPSAVATQHWARRTAVEIRPSVRPDLWAFSRDLDPITSPHPLLARWGSRPLESAQLLGAGRLEPTPLDVIGPNPLEPVSLLHRIQDDIRAGRAPAGDHPEPDPSIQVHAAPGINRQVEVLRDVILGLLRDNSELTEADIAIICPQLGVLAPTISAVLGPPAARGDQPEPGAAPALRYTLVDRDARSFNPVLAAMAALVDLIPGRFDTTVVRDLLHTPAVQARFGLGPSDLDLLSLWIDRACIRWGLAGEHRTDWGISASHEANSWASGIDQLMMGVALGDPLLETAPSAGTEPETATGRLAVGPIAVMELDEGSMTSAGRLTTAIRSLGRAHELLVGSPPTSGPDPAEPVHRTVTEWSVRLRQVADLLVQPDRFEDWQRARFDEILSELCSHSADPDGQPSTTSLTFGDMRRLLGPALEGQRVRADLGYGAVVVARPAVLAGVPFRVIAVLGLDENAIPTRTGEGDDLMAIETFVGDREPRSEGRAELLGALMAAGENLIITCTSRDVRTNEDVPHSVVLDELLDTVTATLTPSQAGAEAVAPLVRTHPRQGFDPANFVSGNGGSFSFDPSACNGARVLTQRALSAAVPGDGVLVSGPVVSPMAEDEAVELAELQAFYRHPVKAFFGRSLNITIPGASEDPDTLLPVGLGGLDRYAIGMALLDARLKWSGDAESFDVSAAVEGFGARGLLPPEAVATDVLEEIDGEVAEIVDHARGTGAIDGPRGDLPVEVILPSGTGLRGVVSGHPDGLDRDRDQPAPGPLLMAYSRYKPKYRLSVVIDLLALTANHPSVPWRGLVVTRADKTGKPPTLQKIQVIGQTAEERRNNSETALDALVAQYRDGLRLALPLFDWTSHQQFFKPGSAAQKWGSAEGQDFGSSECRDVYHHLAFGPISFDELTELEVDGHSLAGEAKRLWGTIDGVIAVDPKAGSR